jgi:hypothetical protein
MSVNSTIRRELSRENRLGSFAHSRYLSMRKAVEETMKKLDNPHGSSN